MNLLKKNTANGFTLIELLIVIAVLGVLAAVVLVIINPVEQLARGRDSGRKSTISQLGTAIQTYYTTTSTYPPSATWKDDLTATSGELKTFPTNPAGVAACGVNPQPNGNGFCYDTANVNGTDEAVVFTRLESRSERAKCNNTAANTWYVWSSAEGKAGVICQAATPQPGITGLLP